MGHEVALVPRAAQAPAGSDGIDRAFAALSVELGRYERGDVGHKEDSELIGDVALLERLLRRAHRFGDYAKRFALLEFETYLEISRHVTESMRGRVKDGYVIDFLVTLDDAQVEEVRKKVASGVRLKTIVNEKHRCDATNDNFAKLRNMSDEIVADYRRSGSATCSASIFYEGVCRKSSTTHVMSVDIVDMFTRETRERLLKAGAVSIGDGSGRYFNPGDKDTGKAIANRIKEIKADIMAVVRICTACPDYARNDLFDSVRETLRVAEETVAQTAEVMCADA